MSKKKEAKAMTMRMVIEMADNGIIIRNPDCEDDVTLALEKGQRIDNIDKSDEYKAVGKRVLDWLMNIVLGESSPTEIIVTGFDLTVESRCTGRNRL